MTLERAIARFARLLDTERPDPGPAPWPELDLLGETFALSPFERDLTGLCAAVEADPAIAALCGARHGDPSRTWPSFGLALACLDDPHWSALSPGRPLRYWRVIAVDPQPTITTGRLTLDERILHFLLGVEYLDARLEGVITEVGGGAGLSPSQQRITERLAELVRARRERGAWPAVQLLGPPGAAKRAVASAACAQLGWRLRTVQAGALPTEPVALAELRRLWEREAVLSGSALLIEAEDASPDALTALHAFATDLQGVVLVSAREAVPALGHAPLLSVERPVAGERSALWTAALGARAAGLNGMVERLGDQFDLDLDALHGASAEALAGSDGTQSLGGALWRACRERSRPALDDLAQRIDPVATIEDVVLPPAQRELLAQIVAQVRRRGTVYERWGFAAASSRGLGITALFAGPSGTGKTMAAEAIARELELDLYRIDLSAVVSKYIGETEKNLRRVFDAAEGGGAVLLFDEADALFGKRTDVKDSHDRYANIEVSYLLTRMECYRGLAILTTNLKDSVDPAFLRRLRFVVSFPFPDPAARAAIWQRIFPAAAPTRELVPATLAKLAIPGGSIRNVALGAAFLAADENAPVGMEHLLAAARSEYLKLERPLTSSELDWSR